MAELIRPYAKNVEFIGLPAVLGIHQADKVVHELSELLGGKIPFGPVQTVTDILDDPHVEARNLIAEVDHPGVEGKMRIANTPIHMTRTPGGVHRRAPMLGEDTDAILKDAGYSVEDIETMRKAAQIS